MVLNKVNENLIFIIWKRYIFGDIFKQLV